MCVSYHLSNFGLKTDKQNKNVAQSGHEWQGLEGAALGWAGQVSGILRRRRRAARLPRGRQRTERAEQDAGARGHRAGAGAAQSPWEGTKGGGGAGTPRGPPTGKPRPGGGEGGREVWEAQGEGRCHGRGMAGRGRGAGRGERAAEQAEGRRGGWAAS